MLSWPAAHAICLGLFGLDLAARALRIQRYTAAVGHPIRLREAFVVNAWGDAAAGLTPMRVGGEVSRLARLFRAGVPPARALLAVGIEVVVAYPVVALFGGLLFWRFAPDWWAHAGPDLKQRLAGAWRWGVAVLAASLLAGAWAWRWRRVPLREPERGLGRVRPAWAGLPRGPVLVGVVASFLNVACRTLMLPVLLQALPVPPPIGVSLVGSFVLLYSQLVLPTPAGAGAVDLALLAGAGGAIGGAGLLVAWRFYTVGGGVLLGVALAVHAFGLRPLARSATRFLRPRVTPAAGAAPSPPA